MLRNRISEPWVCGSIGPRAAPGRQSCRSSYPSPGHRRSVDQGNAPSRTLVNPFALRSADDTAVRLELGRLQKMARENDRSYERRWTVRFAGTVDTTLTYM